MIVSELRGKGSPNCCSCCGCQMACERGEKHYSISPPRGNPYFTAREELDCCCRKAGCLCRRDFELVITDKNKQDVYLLDHGRMCCSWLTCCACCRHRMGVLKLPNRTPLGFISSGIKGLCSCYPPFYVKDATGTVIYTLRKDVNCIGYCCGRTECCGCICDYPQGYVIKSSAGVEGKVERSESHMGDLGKEDTFSVTFPTKADEEHRALLVAATILLDYTLYDDDPPPKQDMK